MHLIGSDGESPAGDGLHCGIGRVADDASADVDGEEHTRIQQRGGNHRHDGHEGFESHAPVADEADIRFIGNQLRGRAAGHQRMEAGDRAAGNRDEDERKHLAAENRAGAVDEVCDRRHLQVRMHDHDGNREQHDDAELEKGRQVVARRQQQPHRQNSRDPAVADHEARDGLRSEVEILAEELVVIDPPAAKGRK